MKAKELGVFLRQTLYLREGGCFFKEIFAYPPRSHAGQHLTSATSREARKETLRALHFPEGGGGGKGRFPCKKPQNHVSHARGNLQGLHFHGGGGGVLARLSLLESMAKISEGFHFSS